MAPTGRKIETYHRYFVERCSSGEEWWAHSFFFFFLSSSGAAWEGRMQRDFECGRRGSKVVKCVWLRPKSLGFAGSTPALFCKRWGDCASVRPGAAAGLLGPGSVVG